jgi:hypothetical protein
LHATAKALREQGIAPKGSKVLPSINQPDGFDCPGCGVVGLKFRRAGAPMFERVFAGLTDVEGVMGMLDRGNRDAAGDKQRNELCYQPRADST